MKRIKTMTFNASIILVGRSRGLASRIRSTLLFCGSVFSLAFLSPVTAPAQGTAFTHQGRLEVSGVPATGAYDFQFSAFGAASGGTAVAGPIIVPGVGVTAGMFNVRIDFGPGVFGGAARWVEMGVRPAGSGGAYSTLSPRQELTPAPYAIFATSASAAASVAPGSVGTAGIANGAVNSVKITDGTILAADLSPGLLGNTFWSLAGNAGTTPGNSFLGTTDNQAVEIKANNLRLLRLEPLGNIIGGYGDNQVSSGISRATIGGGDENLVTANAGTIAGGVENRIRINALQGVIAGGNGNELLEGADSASIGGGIFNANQGRRSVIAGGEANRIQTNSAHAAIGGGLGNVVQTNATFGTIAGGRDNRMRTLITTGEFASTNAPHFSSIGGGESNVVSGADWATVPGGRQNVAGGNYSFAAGRRARANHNGSFVWADDTDADFDSTATKQFAVRAENGVVIQSTGTALDLRGGGVVRATGAGIGTATPVFTHRAIAGGVNGAETRIDHPHCNGQPNAMLIVTHVFNPANTPAGTRNDHAVGVYYNGSRWAIYNLDGALMPIGASFNVLVVQP
jgi:hypothetical protein